MSQRTRAALPLPAHAAAEHHVRAAASVVFNLEGYTVLQALDRPLGGRRVVVAADAAEGAGRLAAAVARGILDWCRGQFRIQEGEVAAAALLVGAKLATALIIAAAMAG